MAEKIASLQFDYSWTSPALGKLNDYIQNHILAFIGEDHYLWGTFEQTGNPSIEHKFDNLTEFQELLSIEFVRMGIYINAIFPVEREFHFNYNPSNQRAWGSFKI